MLMLVGSGTKHKNHTFLLSFGMKLLMEHALFLLMFIIAALSSTGVGAQINVQNVQSDAEWIMECIVPGTGGAIAQYIPDYNNPFQIIAPYMANYAAMGLARAYGVTGNSTFIDAAWTWLHWYRDHMELPQGFVYDWHAFPTNLTSTGHYDSTDAYAGTFLVALLEAFKWDSDMNQLQSLAQGVELAVTAIEASQDPTDGMTWATPDYHAKYLMDQAEAYAGLVAASKLAQLLDNPELAERAQNDSIRMFNGVQTLWNDTSMSFNIVKFGNGAVGSNNWTTLYPDAVSEPWAVAWGLATPGEADNIMALFEQFQPAWDQPLGTSWMNLDGTFSKNPTGYWAEAGLGFVWLQNYTMALAAAASIREAAMSQKRGWPFNPGVAGQLICLESLEVPGTFTVPISSGGQGSSSSGSNDAGSARSALPNIWSEQYLKLL